MIVLRLPGGLSLRLRPRALVVGLAGTLLALALAVLAVGAGDYPIAPADVLRVLAGGGSPADGFIVTELRLPRLSTALAAGAALGLAGAVFQSLTRNALGSPDVLGVTSGAATGALTVVVAGGGSAALAGAAAAGGLATGLLLYALAGRHGVGGHRLVLVGIGVTAVLTGVNGWLLTRAPLMDAARAALWITGSLDGRGWANALPVLGALAVLLPAVLLARAPALRLLEMGDDSAASLGVSVRRVRTAALGSAVLLVSVAAAAAGPVSFLALTAPHLARRLTRAPGPNLLPSAVVGAALLLAADQLAQHAVAGRQLPVGVVTGVLGGGYLAWLLAGERGGRR
ncbi:iron chelate uptake ABC transporter family permease subunit [Micromonospora halotolerans]|uniref:Iron chelate uptake ABC transporter family permease subunit n=1 Tax=Micromonospora halotolerans TaxID=709879 RepID=A0ABY9ZUG9_9ACTN|nr:iron chelate uptake ABC transporter family permease subunit [Micromonospora halotolerans]WNM38798.1 iron chelate uptake ABC transporter family permease subunit [Micromonospora halotolerans]